LAIFTRGTAAKRSIPMKFDNRDRGALFRNDKKLDGDDDRLPDYGGTIDVAGAKFWINGWIKTSKTGSKFLSLSVKPKEAAKTMVRPARTHSWREDL
jgi:hypothetical protein